MASRDQEGWQDVTGRQARTEHGESEGCQEQRVLAERWASKGRKVGSAREEGEEGEAGGEGGSDCVCTGLPGMEGPRGFEGLPGLQGRAGRPGLVGMRGPRGPVDREEYELMGSSGEWYLTSADGHVYHAARSPADSPGRVKQDAAADMFIIPPPPGNDRPPDREIFRRADLAPSSWWCRACSRLFSGSTLPSCRACSQ
eukprot:702335-Hanusia_phi.AAC.3